MSDTPRTDALVRHIGQWKVVYADDCRELERENAALRSKLEEAERNLKYYGELHARERAELERKLAEATK